ncbi:MAG: phytanoyl-CoA dioxygenase family protein [Phycisphaeraceae bacterium]|nr:phytanoyl-CoA dioxygenase family protein [Phycisphaeraceae bacterium]
MVSDMDKYLFDLRGYLLLKGALSQQEVGALNAGLDTVPPLESGAWWGYVQREPTEDSRGIALQQVYELGPPFEELIDHSAWIDKVKYFVGGDKTFDYHHGPLFIDENFASIRTSGGAIGMHSGGHIGVKRTQFRFHNGRFACGQVNVLMALTDIGPGDGATMVVPGSHKANFEHPQFEKHRIQDGASMDQVAEAIEVHMAAGDVLLFVDAISHGSARRVNPGQRRIVVYRYGPSWGNFRWGYQPSKELLARLTPARRQIVQPLQLRKRQPNLKSGIPDPA